MRKVSVWIQAISCCLFLSSQALAQADYWAIFPNTKLTTLTGGTSTISNQVYAGSNKTMQTSAFDKYGNLLFSATNYALYNASGNSFFIIGGAESEIEIFPVLNRCNRFNVLYWSYANDPIGTGNHLKHLVVDASSGSPSVISNTTIATNASVNYYELGVVAAPLDASGNRYVYTLERRTISRRTFYANGTYSGPTSLGTAGMDVSTPILELTPDGQTMAYNNAYGGNQNKITLFNLATNTFPTALTVPTPPGADYAPNVQGLEYDPSTQNWYVSYFAIDGANSAGGLGYFNHSTGGFMNVSSSAPSFGFSEIERGRDGKLYFAANPSATATTTTSPGTVYSINPSSGNALGSVLNSGVAVTCNSYSNGKYFITNQIDGEDYGNYYLPVQSGDFVINGEARVLPSPGGGLCVAQEIGGCPPAAMDLTFTAGLGGLPGTCEYEIKWEESDGCGNVYASSPLNYADDTWHEGPVETIDLRFYGNGTLNSSQAVNKYFVITAYVHDPCGQQVWVCEALVHVRPLDPTPFPWQLSDVPGTIAVAPGNSCADAVLTCGNEPTVNFEAQSGNVMEYWLKVLEYPAAGCGGGTAPVVICDGSDSKTPVTGTMDVAQSLPAYLVEKAAEPYNVPDYFMSNPGNTYEVQLWSGNPCGEVMISGYFVNNAGGCRGIPAGVASSGGRSLSVAAVPNPASDYFSLVLDGLSGTSAEAGLYNISGQKVRGAAADRLQGRAALRMDIRELPAGMYFYKCSADGQLFTGKLNIVH